MENAKKVGIVSLLFGIICIVVGITLIQGENSVWVAGLMGVPFTAMGFALLFTYYMMYRKSKQ